MSPGSGRQGGFWDDFGPFDGRVWLNCAHQGPLPRVAAEAAREALSWKVDPTRLGDERFFEVPDRLRASLARLVDGAPVEVVLGNSTSHGLHLLANGIPWREGDEVLLVEGDFPASILPWLGVEDRGVEVRFVRPRGEVLTAEDVDEALGPRTRLLCATWVDSFTGHALDPDAVGALCRTRGVTFVLNGSQAVGIRPLSVSETAVDAVASCGFKWLCGPYGTGFLWARRELLESLEANRAYWLAMQRGRDLDDMRDYELRDDLGPMAWDVFGTANFLNFVPWTASVDHLTGIGLPRIRDRVSSLVDRLVEGLDEVGLEVTSPRKGPERSSLVFGTVRGAGAGGALPARRNAELVERLEGAGVHVSLREGRIRISPHLYNTGDDVDRLLDVLDLETGRRRA